MMSRPGFVILGFDDTFLNLRAGYAKLFSTVFKQFGMPFDEDSVLEYAETPLDQLFSKYNRGCTCRFRDFVTMVTADYEECVIDSARLRHDAYVLKELKNEGVRLGIVTSAFEEHVRRLLEKFDMAEMFDSVVGCERLTLPLPDPYGINMCLREMGAGREETVMITTSPRDSEASAAAGIRSVVLERSADGSELAECIGTLCSKT